MPTGYTAKLCEKEQSFEEFVWGCARGMGAFIMQRDDAGDAPPVLEDKPSDHYTKSMKRKQAELARLGNLTSDSVTIEREYLAECERVKAENAKYAKETKGLRKRLDDMKARVKAWKPPTAEHEGLQRFMLEQLQSTIDFDGTAYTQSLPEGPPAAWHLRRIACLQESIEYDEQHNREEIERTNSRNEWKRQLLASVPLPKGGAS